tara:strand:+ start:91 stop:582 length:492 start_codon:yes stop_codon:yes gene_type:complete
MEWTTLISIVSIIAASGAVIGLIVETWYLKKIKDQSENNQYTETLRKSMDDLYQVYRTDFDVKKKEEAELVGIRILDILSILAHLHNKEKITDEMLDFVEFDLQIAKGIMEWFDKEKLSEKYGESSSKEIWKNLDTYFENKKDIKTCKNEALPECIKNYNDLK